jgi:hypothetical protein
MYLPKKFDELIDTPVHLLRLGCQYLGERSGIEQLENRTETIAYFDDII